MIVEIEIENQTFIIVNSKLIYLSVEDCDLITRSGSGCHFRINDLVAIDYNSLLAGEAYFEEQEHWDLYLKAIDKYNKLKELQ